MKKLTILLIVTSLSVACANTELASDSQIALGKRLISTCESEALRLVSGNFAMNTDRVYVYLRDSGAWLIFSTGEIGTFGKRDDDSMVRFSCGVLNGKTAEVKFLGAPFADPLKDDRYWVESFSLDESLELLYKRSSRDTYEYCCSQDYDPRRIDKRNPAPKGDKVRVSESFQDFGGSEGQGSWGQGLGSPVSLSRPRSIARASPAALR